MSGFNVDEMEAQEVRHENEEETKEEVVEGDGVDGVTGERAEEAQNEAKMEQLVSGHSPDSKNSTPSSELRQALEQLRRESAQAMEELRLERLAKNELSRQLQETQQAPTSNSSDSTRSSMLRQQVQAAEKAAAKAAAEAAKAAAEAQEAEQAKKEVLEEAERAKKALLEEKEKAAKNAQERNEQLQKYKARAANELNEQLQKYKADIESAIKLLEASAMPDSPAILALRGIFLPSSHETEQAPTAKEADAPQCPECLKKMQWSDYAQGDYKDGWACANVETCGQQGSVADKYRWFCKACSNDLCSRCAPRHEAPKESYRDQFSLALTESTDELIRIMRGKVARCSRDERERLATNNAVLLSIFCETLKEYIQSDHLHSSLSTLNTRKKQLPPSKPLPPPTREVCVCGSIFTKECTFCRKCGRKKEEVGAFTFVASKAEASMYGLPEDVLGDYGESEDEFQGPWFEITAGNAKVDLPPVLSPPRSRLPMFRPVTQSPYVARGMAPKVDEFDEDGRNASRLKRATANAKVIPFNTQTINHRLFNDRRKQKHVKETTVEEPTIIVREAIIKTHPIAHCAKDEISLYYSSGRMLKRIHSASLAPPYLPEAELTFLQPMMFGPELGLCGTNTKQWCMALLPRMLCHSTARDIIIGGISLGGVIAFDVARLMEFCNTGVRGVFELDIRSFSPLVLSMFTPLLRSPGECPRTRLVANSAHFITTLGEIPKAISGVEGKESEVIHDDQLAFGGRALHADSVEVYFMKSQNHTSLGFKDAWDVFKYLKPMCAP